ncbi:hypothetical protein AX17_001681 [Amanita inopinata Kibby_2008]|nr:hypothetical protein AX17_001681 [Amanita inopinata Kibby_2008]
MSNSTRETSAASGSGALRVHKLNATAPKRSSSEDREHTAGAGSKKRKRDAHAVHELGSSVVAAPPLSQSFAPPDSTVMPYSTSAIITSPNNDKKKRKKRKKKTSIVDPEFDNRAKQNGVAPTTRSESALSATIRTSFWVGCTEQASQASDVTEVPAACRSNSDKGKGKEKARSLAPSTQSEPSPMAHTQSSQMNPLQAQIDSLKQQLEAQSQLLQKHQTHIASIHQSLTCQICLDLLYKPFALAPCGHVACYDCLVRWFTAPGADQNATGNSNANQRNATLNNITSNYVHKRKTCPVCRSSVLERPVEVWGIKDMVNGLVKSKLVENIPSSGMVEATASTSDRQNTRSSERATGAGAVDPWQRIFRSMRKSHVGYHDWINNVAGEAPDRIDGGLEEVGMYDAEDRVHRCVDCMHEIWGGRCTNCDREYPGHSPIDDEEDEDEEVMMDFDGGDDNDEDVDEFSFALGAMLGHMHGRSEEFNWVDELHRIDELHRRLAEESTEEDDIDEDEDIFDDVSDEDEDEWDGSDIYGRMRPLFWNVGGDGEDDDEDGIARVEEVNEGEGQEVEETDDGDGDGNGYEGSFIDDEGEEEGAQVGRIMRIGGVIVSDSDDD